MYRRIAFLASLAGLAASSAAACAFHGYAPQETFVERLLGSDHIVLARPSRESPFRYSEIEVLEGGADFVDIPHLVDSTTRRKLAARPEDHVLFARDGAYGPWERIAYVNAEMDQVLQTVMENLPAWQMGGDPERFSYFASLLNSPDIQVQTLALKELDLADYGVLRALALNVDAQRLRSRLDLQFEADLKPIRILLLGLSQEQVDTGFFEAGIDRNAPFSGGVLGAYATAMIEHGGPDAAARLVDRYLRAQALPSISRELLTEALAIHSSANDAAMRESIRAALDRAIRDDPSLAPMVARHFGARYDWSQSDAILDLIQSGTVTSPLEILLLTQYVSLAKEAAQQN